MLNKKDNTVRVVTDNKTILESYPIEKYIKHRPSYFKNAPSKIQFDDEVVPFKTAKYCDGFSDYFNTAYLLRWNSDLVIDINNEDQSYDFFPNISENTYRSVGFFNSEMYGDQHINKKRYTNIIFKISTNWNLIANKPSRFLVMDPYFNYNDQGLVMTGIFDAYRFTQVNVMFESYVKQYVIKRGDPAMVLIPLDNQKLISDYKTEKDIDHINKRAYNYDTTIYNSYNKMKDIL